MKAKVEVAKTVTVSKKQVKSTMRDFDKLVSRMRKSLNGLDSLDCNFYGRTVEGIRNAVSHAAADFEELEMELEVFADDLDCLLNPHVAHRSKSKSKKACGGSGCR